MPIRPLPPVPTRDDPANFALKGDAFLAVLPGFRDDCNALEQSMQAMATMGISTSSLTVGTGSKSLTTEPGKAWATGAWVYVFASAAVSNYMVGRVTSYNATTGALVVNVSAIDGGGTHSAWVIGLATPQIDTHLLPRDGSRAMTAELLLAANAVNGLGAVPKQQMDAAVAAAIVAAMPAGTEIAFGGVNAPAGFLKLNGAVPPVSSVPNLVAAVYCGDANNATASYYYRCTNASNPSGTRSTTGEFFVLKDARGRFGRALPDGSAINSGRSMWSYEDDTLQDHRHHWRGSSALGGIGFESGGLNNGAYHDGGAISGAVDARVSGETRPINYPSLVCVKI